MIKRMDHVTLNVKDIEATRRFYVDILGFRERQMVDCGDHCYHFFESPGGITLEVGIDNFDDSIAVDTPTSTGKLRHIAFEVDDIMAMKTRLEEAGYMFSSTVEYRGGELGFISGQLHDPSGIELEFLQYANAQ